MFDRWQDFPGAPSPGHEICDGAALAEGAALCLEIDGFPLLLLRRGGRVTGFVNACPHQFLPLNQRGSTILSADGTRLLCTNHGASFDAVTGEGRDGFGAGCRLVPVPLREEGGRIHIA